MKREEAIPMLEQIGRHECIWMACRHDEVYKTIDMAIEALKAQRPHGEWIPTDEIGYVVRCSECKYETLDDVSEEYDFCPRCGLPMTDKALAILRKREGET